MIDTGPRLAGAVEHRLHAVEGAEHFGDLVAPRSVAKVHVGDLVVRHGKGIARAGVGSLADRTLHALARARPRGVPC